MHTKKILLLILWLALAFVHNAGAHKDDEVRPAFERNNIVSVAAGIQSVRTYDQVSYSPAFILSFEHVTINMLGPGVLSVGAVFGIYRATSSNYLFTHPGIKRHLPRG